LLTRNDLDAAVLSYQELAPEFSVQPLVTIVAEAGKLGQSVELRLEPDAPAMEPVAGRNGAGATVAAPTL
jgi:hypothetical protein